MDVLIVGAGFSGAVLGRELAQVGHKVSIFEMRDHVAGNCHTLRDPQTGVLEHRYGPHIFHTDDQAVWDYVQTFATFRPYRHQVKTTIQGQVFSLPINLHTINQFFKRSFGPDEAKEFISAQSLHCANPQNFEQQALNLLGPDLYEAFFRGYTHKQWGMEPKYLPASIFKRLPVRFSYDDSYFFHRYEALPEEGYTALITRILDHPNIDVHLERPFVPLHAKRYGHVFYSGSLDSWFNNRLGRLGYRTLDFERFRSEHPYQGCAVMNYGDADIPYTRITEHHYFSPWEQHEHSLLTQETPRACGPDDIPYYPIRLAHEKALLAEYVALAEGEDGVTFIGRLGTYRYLDMDVCIREALHTAQVFLTRGGATPAFVHPPLPMPAKTQQHAA